MLGAEVCILLTAVETFASVGACFAVDPSEDEDADISGLVARCFVGVVSTCASPCLFRGASISILVSRTSVSVMAVLSASVISSSTGASSSIPVSVSWMRNCYENAW